MHEGFRNDWPFTLASQPNVSTNVFVKILIYGFLCSLAIKVHVISSTAEHVITFPSHGNSYLT